MVFVWTAAAAFEDLQVHAAGYDVAGCEVFGGRGVALHESLALAVEEVAAFSSGAFSDQDLWLLLVGESRRGEEKSYACAVDPRWVELYELHVL